LMNVKPAISHAGKLRSVSSYAGYLTMKLRSDQ